MNQKNIYISHELSGRGGTKAADYVVQSKSRATNKSPYLTNLMDEISTITNLRLAFRAVKRNKGSAVIAMNLEWFSKLGLFCLSYEFGKHKSKTAVCDIARTVV